MVLGSRNPVPSKSSTRARALAIVSKLVIAATVMAIFLLAVPGPALADGVPATLPALPTQIMSPVFNVSPGGDIQTAVDAAYKEGGGTVNLASGRFDITAPIIPRSNVTIQGQGSTGSGMTTIYNALGANMVIMVALGVLRRELVEFITRSGLAVSYRRPVVEVDRTQVLAQDAVRLAA